MRRLEKDRPTITMVEAFSFKQIMLSASSPHVIIVTIMLFMTGMMAYGLALFLPSIVNELGFGTTETQLLSVGPFVAGFIGDYFYSILHSIKVYSPLASAVTLISASLSDRYAVRGIVISLVSILAVAGFALFLSNVALLDSDVSFLTSCIN